MRHNADDCQGPLYDYLGHFKQRQYLVDGHNSEKDNIPEMAKANFNIVSNRDTVVGQDRDSFAGNTPRVSAYGQLERTQARDRGERNEPISDDPHVFSQMGSKK